MDPLFHGWQTEENVPDPNKKDYTLCGSNILVRPLIPSKQVGNIIMPDAFHADISYLSNVGKVIALGPLAYKDSWLDGSKPEFYNNNPYGRFGKPWCKEGDFVVWAKNQGVKIKINGVICILLADDRVLFTVSNPAIVSPQANLSKEHLMGEVT